MAVMLFPAQRLEAPLPAVQASLRPDARDARHGSRVPPVRGRRTPADIANWVCVVGITAASAWMVTTTVAQGATAFSGTTGGMGEIAHHPPALPEAIAGLDGGLLPQPSTLLDAGVETSAPPVAAPQRAMAPIAASEPPVPTPNAPYQD